MWHKQTRETSPSWAVTSQSATRMGRTSLKLPSSLTARLLLAEYHRTAVAVSRSKCWRSLSSFLIQLRLLWSWQLWDKLQKASDREEENWASGTAEFREWSEEEEEKSYGMFSSFIRRIKLPSVRQVGNLSVWVNLASSNFTNLFSI